MTSKGSFCAIVKRMKETHRMWSLVRYFYKNQLKFISWDNKDTNRTAENTGKPIPEFINEMMSISMQTRDPRVYRMTVATQFGGDEYRKKRTISIEEWGKLGVVEQKKDQELARDYVADAQIRIGSCINAEYILADKENDMLVYLPLKGKRFATVMGLIKAWGDDLSEIVGSWKLIVITFIATAGIVRWEWVVHFTKWISGNI